MTSNAKKRSKPASDDEDDDGHVLAPRIRRPRTNLVSDSNGEEDALHHSLVSANCWAHGLLKDG
jgi:hypothetical protein